MTSRPPKSSQDLLDGEDPESPFLEDAIHWINVYSELLVLKHAMLERAADVLVGAAEDTEREAQFDENLLREQAVRYERRLEFWRKRALELDADAR